METRVRRWLMLSVFAYMEAPSWIRDDAAVKGDVEADGDTLRSDVEATTGGSEAAAPGARRCSELEPNFCGTNLPAFSRC